jgi:hypothetical protein
MNGILAPQLIPLILEKLEDKDLYAYGWINQKSFEEANQIWYRKCVEPKEDYFKTYTEQKYNRLTHILNQLLLTYERCPLYMKKEIMEDLIDYYLCQPIFHSEKRYEPIKKIMDQKIIEFGNQDSMFKRYKDKIKCF